MKSLTVTITNILKTETGKIASRVAIPQLSTFGGELHLVEGWLEVTRTRISLGLLPSGSDPVGEEHVHHQPSAGSYRIL